MYEKFQIKKVVKKVFGRSYCSPVLPAGPFPFIAAMGAHLRSFFLFWSQGAQGLSLALHLEVHPSRIWVTICGAGDHSHCLQAP